MKKLMMFAMFAICFATSADDYTLNLAKGKNFVSIPISPIDERIPEIFVDILPNIKSVSLYNTENKEWVTYQNNTPEFNNLTEISAGSAFFMDVDKDVSQKIVQKSDEEDIAIFAKELNTGWSPIGIRKEITKREFSRVRKEDYDLYDFSFDYDSIYSLDENGEFVEVASDDNMQVGKGYWINNDPDGDNISSAEEIWNADGTERNNPSSPTDVNSATTREDDPPDDNSTADDGTSKNDDGDTTTSTEEPEESIGAFDFVNMEKDMDSDELAVAGRGELNSLPANLKGLLSLPENLKIAITYRNGLAISAYNKESFSSNQEITIAPNTANAITFKGTQINYLSISKTGDLYIGVTKDIDSAGHALGERNFVIRWTDLDENNKVGVKSELEDNPIIYLKTVLNEEIGVTKIWYKNEDDEVQRFVKTIGDDYEWWLQMPNLGQGVIDLYYNEDNRYEVDLNRPDKWLPFTFSGDEKNMFKSLSITKCLLMRETLGSGNAAQIDDWQEKTVTLTNNGHIKIDGKPFEYIDGRLRISPSDWFHIDFKGWNRTPNINLVPGAGMNVRAEWSPVFALFLDYTGDNFEIIGGCQLEAGVVFNIINQNKGKSGLSQVSKEIANIVLNKIKTKRGKETNESSHDSNADGCLSSFLEGSNLLINPSFRMTAKQKEEGDDKFRFDVMGDVKLGVGSLADGDNSKYAFKTQFNAGIHLNNIPYIGDLKVDFKHLTRWRSDKLFSEGTIDQYEESASSRCHYMLETKQMPFWPDSFDMELGAQIIEKGSYLNGDKNNRRYKKQSFIVARALADSNDKEFDAGWKFGIEMLRFEFEAEEFIADNAIFAMLGMEKDSDTIHDRFGSLEKVIGFATLELPADFDIPCIPNSLDATILWEKLPETNQEQNDRGTKSPPYKLTIITDFKAGDLEIGDLKMKLTSMILSYNSQRKAWMVLFESEFDFDNQHIDGMLMVEKDKSNGDWKFMLSAEGLKFGDHVSAQDLLIAFTYNKNNPENGKKKWSEVTAQLGINVKWDDLDDMGYPEGLYAGATYSDGDIIVQLENIPLTVQDDLPDTVQFEKFRNVELSIMKDGRKRLGFDVDVIFNTFVENPDSTPRSEWPRASFGFTGEIEPKKEGTNKPFKERLSVEGRCENLGPWYFKKNSEKPAESWGMTMTKISVAREAGGLWKFKGGVKFDFDDNWHLDVGERTIEFPDDLNGDFEFSKTPTGPALKAALKWQPAPQIDIDGLKTKIEFTEFIFTKASPWSIGLGTNLNLDGQIYTGEVGLGKEGLALKIPNQKLNIPLGNDVNLELSEYSLRLGRDLAITANVLVDFRESEVLQKVFGDQLTARLSGNKDGFTCYADIDLMSTLSLGELGEAELGLKTISIASNGEIAANGSMYLNGTGAELKIGMKGGNFFCVADFGEEGISAEVANIFAIKMKHKLGIETLFGFQYVLVDDMYFGVGNDIAGMSLETQKFKYFLPTSVPPVGFPFFDNLEGNIHIVGFEVNVGLNFPAPDEDDAKILFEILVDGANGGDFDPSPLRDLGAPAFGIHDVYVAFPKVPGMAFKDGKFQKTDNQFAEIFGSNKLDLIDKLYVGPATIYDIATASSAFDVAKTMIPHNKRHGRMSLNLRGFDADAGYDLHETDLSKYNPIVPKLADIDSYIKKIRFADKETADFPVVLTINEGCKLLNAWGATSDELTHDVGKPNKNQPFSAQIANLIRTIIASPEVITRKLSDEEFANAVIKGILNRDSKSVTLPTFGSDIEWVVNSFDSRSKNFFDSNGDETIDEATKLVQFLEDGISRGAAVSFIMKHDDFRTKKSPDLSKASEKIQKDFIQNLHNNMVGELADDFTINAWWKTLKPTASWITEANDENASMAMSPKIQLGIGYYKTKVEVKIEDNINDDDVVIIEVVDGDEQIAKQSFRAKDFLFPNYYQKLFVPFQLETASNNIKINVYTTGFAEVALKDIFLYSAIKAQKDVITLPDNLGGGNVIVKWDVVDVSDEMKKIKSFIEFIMPPAGEDWTKYMPQLFEKIKQKAGVPEINGNKLTFNYSENIQLEFALQEYEMEYDISELKLTDDKLEARFGTITIFDTDDQKANEGFIVNENIANFADTNFDDDTLSKITIEGGGKVVLFKNSEYQGVRSLINLSMDSLTTVDIGDNQTSSIKVFFPVYMQDVSKWRGTARTINGTILNYDAGGIEIILPGEPNDIRILSILPDSRLKISYDNMREILAGMNPDSIFDNPQAYLKKYYTDKLIANKNGVKPSGNSLEFKDENGLKHELQLLKRNNNPLTAVGYDIDNEELLGKVGTVKLYQNSNYNGTSLVVFSDIVNFKGSVFGKYPPKSIKLEDGATAVFYPEPHYGDFVLKETFSLRNRKFQGGAGEKLIEGYGVNYNRKLDKNGNQLLSKGPGTKLKKGYYKITYKLKVDKKGSEYQDSDKGKKLLAQYNGDDYGMVEFSGDGGTPILTLSAKAISPFSATLATKTIVKSDLDEGKWKDISVTFELHEDATVDIITKALSDDTPMSIKEYSIHQLKVGLNPEKITGSIGSLSSKKRGSLRVMTAFEIEDVAEWIITRSFPGGNSLSITHGDIKQEEMKNAIQASTVGNDNTKITSALRGSANQFILKKENDDFKLIAQSGNGFIFPDNDYNIYRKITPDNVDDIMRATKYMQKFIRKSIITQEAGEEQISVVNKRGGITTTYLDTPILTENIGGKYSTFELTSKKNHRLKFKLSRNHDLGNAQILNQDKKIIVPTYENSNKKKVGIKIPIPEDEIGGLYVDASLSAGSSSTVKLDVKVSGAIKEDGSFYMNGKGDLIINDYTIAEAEIMIGSKEGLYIRGKLDVYDIAKIDIEGYIRPDGKFQLKGSGKLMYKGTGVKGSILFNNNALNIFGGLYIANYKIKSAEFAVSNGKISYKESIGIGFAGFDYTVWVLIKSPYGAGVKGRAYLNVNIPIYIWGVKKWGKKKIWLPFRKYTIRYPKKWGWKKIGTIRTHFDKSVELSVTGEKVKFGIGPCDLIYNFKRKKIKIDW